MTPADILREYTRTYVDVTGDRAQRYDVTAMAAEIARLREVVEKVRGCEIHTFHGRAWVRFSDILAALGGTL